MTVEFPADPDLEGARDMKIGIPGCNLIWQPLGRNHLRWWTSPGDLWRLNIFIIRKNLYPSMWKGHAVRPLMCSS